MGNLLFWLGIGELGRKKPSRHPLVSFVLGLVVALAIVAGLFVLLVSQQ
jgi:hypothetical protein